MSGEIPADVVLPCGCYLTHKIENGERQLQIAACRAGCVNLANALGLADEASKPVEIREATR